MGSTERVARELLNTVTHNCGIVHGMKDEVRLESASAVAPRAEGVARYLDAAGRVVMYPSKWKAKQLVLAYLSSKFEVDREYTEREVNQLLQEHHTFSDWAVLRRDLFEAGYLGRTLDGTRYWLLARSTMDEV